VTICYWAWNFTFFCLGLYNKQNIHGGLKIWLLSSCVKNNILLTRWLRSFVSIVFTTRGTCHKWANVKGEMAVQNGMVEKSIRKCTQTQILKHFLTLTQTPILYKANPQP
jgi:hypothetical protein